MLIIGLTGRAGCGKDTAGEILRNNHGFSTTALAFPIKAMICTLMGVSMEKWQDRVWKETPHPALGGKSPRYAAQTLGTEWGRDQMGNDFWVNSCIAKVYAEELQFVAITDVRFDNEAQRVRDTGGYVIQILRPEGGEIKETNHASEAGVRDGLIDYKVENAGSIQDLAIELDKLMQVIDIERGYAVSV